MILTAVRIVMTAYVALVVAHVVAETLDALAWFVRRRFFDN